MAKLKSRTYSRQCREAVMLLGRMIKLGRKERGQTAQDLADRAGISRGTLHRLEKGDLGVEIGVSFEVAALVGVALFADDQMTQRQRLEQFDDKIALLPQSIRGPTPEITDDF